MSLKRRILHLLIALDQLAWVMLTLGRGHPDETISAAAFRMEQQGKIAGRILRPLLDILFYLFQKNHCRMSYLGELSREHLPDMYKG